MNSSAASPTRATGLRRATYVASFLGLLGLAACTTTVTATPQNGCSTDGSVSCSSGATGYSCSGSSQPEDTDQNLVCSTDQGTGEFCCYADSSCSYDGTVTGGCESGAYGYSCTGSAAPDQADTTLICSEPNSSNQYCCFTQAFASGVTTTTCAQDQTVTGCTEDGAGQEAFGFSCTGSDTPGDDFSNLNCSAGVPDTASGNTDYCCSYN